MNIVIPVLIGVLAILSVLVVAAYVVASFPVKVAKGASPTNGQKFQLWISEKLPMMVTEITEIDADEEAEDDEKSGKKDAKKSRRSKKEKAAEHGKAWWAVIVKFGEWVFVIPAKAIMDFCWKDKNGRREWIVSRIPVGLPKDKIRDENGNEVYVRSLGLRWPDAPNKPFTRILSFTKDLWSGILLIAFGFVLAAFLYSKLTGHNYPYYSSFYFAVMQVGIIVMVYAAARDRNISEWVRVSYLLLAILPILPFMWNHNPESLLVEGNWFSMIPANIAWGIQAIDPYLVLVIGTLVNEFIVETIRTMRQYGGTLFFTPSEDVDFDKFVTMTIETRAVNVDDDDSDEGSNWFAGLRQRISSISMPTYGKKDDGSDSRGSAREMKSVSDDDSDFRTMFEEIVSDGLLADWTNGKAYEAFCKAVQRKGLNNPNELIAWIFEKAEAFDDEDAAIDAYNAAAA